MKHSLAISNRQTFNAESPRSFHLGSVSVVSNCCCCCDGGVVEDWEGVGEVVVVVVERDWTMEYARSKSSNDNAKSNL